MVESAIVDNQSSGLGVTSPYNDVYSRATITRSVVGRTTMNELGGARAVEAADGAELVVEDSTLVQSEEVQVIAEHPGTMLRLTDVVVRGPITDDGGDSGPGVIVGQGAAAEIQRTAIVGNRVMGIYAQLGGAVTLRQSLVQGTLPSRGGSVFGDAHFGIGAAVLPGSRLDAVDTAFVSNREMSLFVRGQGAAVTLDRVLVADTIFDAGDGYGRGINVQDGASLAAVQTAVLRGTEGGLVSFGSFVTLTDSTVGHTTRGAEDVLAIGVVAALGGRVELRGSTITGNQDVGLIIAASSAYMSGGFVSGNAIGAHVQDGSSLVVDQSASGDAMTCVFSPDTHSSARHAHRKRRGPAPDAGRLRRPVSPPAGGAKGRERRRLIACAHVRARASAPRRIEKRPREGRVHFSVRRSWQCRRMRIRSFAIAGLVVVLSACGPAPTAEGPPPVAPTPQAPVAPAPAALTGKAPTARAAGGVLQGAARGRRLLLARREDGGLHERRVRRMDVWASRSAEARRCSSPRRRVRAVVRVFPDRRRSPLRVRRRRQRAAAHLPHRLQGSPPRDLTADYPPDRRTDS